MQGSFRYKYTHYMLFTYLSCSKMHEHKYSSFVSTRWPGNRCEPSAERHALKHEQHDHSSTHQHLTTRARARRREHSSTSTSTRWPGNLCEPPVEWRMRHLPVGHCFNHVGLHAPGWLKVLGMTPRGYLPVSLL